MSDVKTEMPVLDQVMRMNLDSVEHSKLDPRTFMEVRIAALAATGAAPIAWATNLGAGAEVGLTVEDVQGVLVAITPLIGTARTVAAAGNALRGLGMIAVAGAAAEDEDA